MLSMILQSLTKLVWIGWIRISSIDCSLKFKALARISLAKLKILSPLSNPILRVKEDHLLWNILIPQAMYHCLSLLGRKALAPLPKAFNNAQRKKATRHPLPDNYSEQMLPRHNEALCLKKEATSGHMPLVITDMCTWPRTSKPLATSLTEHTTPSSH